MKITNFNQTPKKRINQINSYLKEAHGVQVKGLHSKTKLETIKEKAEQTLIRLRNTNRKFNLDPEYAKFLGVRDVIEVMLSEGMYAESPAMQEMKSGIVSEVKALMDGGYTMDEASKECMNKFRKDTRYAHDDEFVLPIVLKAAKDYMEACSSMSEEVKQEFPETDINEYLFQEMAKEVGMEIDNVEALKAIEEKLGMFAEVSGKSRESVVGFLNGLEEDAVANGIQMFGKKVAEQNKFTGARKDAIAQGKKSFEVDGTEFDITGDTKDEKSQAKESMFDDIIGDMISEEVEVEQAEVVMALRALADDVQDHVERIGRMINEDLPAIVDQMKAEFGAEQAVQMKSNMEQTLQSVLDGNKAGKDGLDSVIAGLTGQGTGMVDAPAEPGLDTGLEQPALGGEEEPALDNVPAAAGPEDEPLGRAPVEI
jgi:hypothetical protein|tara:strand:+ start:280 stop:1557 length:1278 start_codon:yes stop_codon:yes gene_type:complete